MTKNEIKEMYKSLANGDDWECKCNGHNTCSQCEIEVCPYETWQPYKLGEAIRENFEYRKVETWYVVSTDRDKEGHIIFNVVSHQPLLDSNIYTEGTKEECEKWIKEHTKKTWLEERYPTEYEDIKTVSNHLAFRTVAKEVCKKILEEVDSHKWNYEDAWDRSFEVIDIPSIHNIIKDLGVEL